MTRLNVLAAVAIGLGAAACSYSTHTTSQATAPVPVRTVTASERACMDYGFTPGTTAYNRCVSNEAEWRARGRVARGYSEDLLLADARQACYSYGLQPASPAYDRCLRHEMNVRRYREEASVTVYTVPSAPPPPPPVHVQPRTTGTEAFRDEYGYRYDAEGNRLDARGNIISPHSKIR
ncbi:MAG: hypothetical protein KIT25_08275 [Enhydrobacter sp.]|nr:MAG: hypothetical protein KIT25_08275 [Enhydrobacter sp.]